MASTLFVMTGSGVVLAMPAIVLQNGGGRFSGWLVLELLDSGLGLAVGPALVLAVRRRLGQSFSTLLTGYRLDEARRRLLDPGHDVYTVDAIAARSGFPSRSTFYAAFRKRFGQSPTAFRRTARRS